MRGRLLCKYSIKKINVIFAKKLQILSLVLESLCQIMQVCAQWLKNWNSLSHLKIFREIMHADIVRTIDLWKSWFHGIFVEKNPSKQISDVLILWKGMYKISWKWWGLEFTKSFSKVVSNMNFLTRKVYVVISVIFPHHDVKKAIWRKNNIKSFSLIT